MATQLSSSPTGIKPPQLSTQEALRTLVLFCHTIYPELSKGFLTIGMGVKFNPATDIPSLDGKVILVTGGNAGLGKQTILNLAAHNPSRIYLAARTAAKASAAIKDIRAAVPQCCDIVHLPLDLTSFSSIAEAAATFTRAESRLDVLVNNAGVMACPYSTTKEGYEVQFGTNHVGHALLTKLLLPTLLATREQHGAARIVVLSSAGHAIPVKGGIVFDQGALAQHMTWKRYGQSKLANILFAKEMALRYPALTTVSVHPGVILTDLYASVNANVLMRTALWVYAFLFPVLPGHFKSVEGGALTQTWAAVADDAALTNGAYYTPVGVESKGNSRARDEGLQRKLWEWTEEQLAAHGY
ncbi:hypothetical protein G6514_000812 [Epicoccum nigrum]|nr:hypothetical protein G6514_000812 [Epicoccum nigrum]